MISRQRRALWQAVSSAEFAVLAAEQSGAPAAELDALCRRLRLAAEDTDRRVTSLRKARLLGQPPPGISDLRIAAEMIQDAAAIVIRLLSDVDELSDPVGDSRAEDIRRHCEAAAARIDSAARAAVGFRECTENGGRNDPRPPPGARATRSD
jgi:hypothetical protein